MAPVENDKNNTPVKTVKAEEETEASEEAEEAQATEADIESLEEAEATEETPDVTVGSTSEEDEISSVRAELVEFVSARLNKYFFTIGRLKMALKPDRIEIYTDISFFMNTVAERGGVVSVVTSGSGVSMDDANAVVEYADSASGAALGILLNDVVDKDLTTATSTGIRMRCRSVAKSPSFVVVNVLQT